MIQKQNYKGDEVFGGRKMWETGGPWTGPETALPLKQKGRNKATIGRGAGIAATWSACLAPDPFHLYFT